MKNTSTQPANLRVLGVFAHPDDEVFCAGGTLAQYAAAGAEIMVVSVTQGEAGQIQDGRAATRQTLGPVRAQELYRACEVLGVQHTLCLNYGDGALQNADSEALTRHITQIIRTFRPDLVITFGPDGAYGHPDHIAISGITTQAFALAEQAAQFPEQLGDSLLPYTPSCLYYSYFPRRRKRLLDRLVQWLVEREGRFQGSVDFAHALLLFSEEAKLLGYSNDYFELSWFPTGYHIVEQGEPATKLYLILSGRAKVMRDDVAGIPHTLAHLGAGSFFGEEGLAYQKPRNAHVVATEAVTCLVFSSEVPSNYAGRGAGAALTDAATSTLSDQADDDQATTCFDVSDYVGQKMAALAAHRTQFSVAPDTLPLEVLGDWFGRECFVPVHPPPDLRHEVPSLSGDE